MVPEGEFDDDKFAADLAERLPEMYARLGYVDFQVIKDTMIVDRARGKALLDLTISEGKQYRVGTFDVIGNRHFSTEEIRRFYPFTLTSATLTERATDLLLAATSRRRPGSSTAAGGMTPRPSCARRTATRATSTHRSVR